MNWTPGNYIRILVIILVVALPAISWVYKKLREQAEIKKAQSQRQRRVEEGLRTGRVESDTSAPEVVVAAPIPVSHADARQRLQELAQRRQRQLEELRRRQQGQSPSEVRAPAPPPVRAAPSVPPIVIFGPTGPMAGPLAGRGAGTPGSLRRGPALPPVARPATQRSPAPAQPPQARPARSPQPRQAAKEQRKRAAQQQAAMQAQTDDSDAVHRLVADSAPTAGDSVATRSPGSGASGARRTGLPIDTGLPRVGVSPEEWRRVILLREILGPPVSLRGGDPVDR